MALIELSSLQYGGQLLVDATAIGTYEVVDERSGDRRELPIWDVSQIIVRDRRVVGKTLKTAGVVKSWVSNAIGPTGRRLEYRDDRTDRQAIYNTTLAERLALRGLHQSGLPSAYGLHWSRFVRGPMSPTLEQEATSVQIGNANGTTFTITTPTSGNLLSLCHGMYWISASLEKAVCSGFTHRVFVGNAASMNILDKIATGDEGTSLVVTHELSRAAENSGWVGEYSGMTATPFITGSTNNNTSGPSSVTSRSPGGSNTGSVAAALIIAALGHAMVGSPTGFSVDASFAIEGSVNGTAGANDHGSKIATRVVSSAGTYTPTFSWTGATYANTVIAAYEYGTNAAPTSLLYGPLVGCLGGPI